MELILITALSIFGGFFIHTILGFGGAVFAVPILAAFYTVPESVTIMTVLYLFFSIHMVIKYWHDMITKEVLLVGCSALVGIWFGSYFLSSIDAATMKKLLGGFILLYLVYTMVKKEKVEWLKKMGVPLGITSGVFSILFGTGGPPMVAYMSNIIDKKKALRASLISGQAFLHFSVGPMLLWTGHVNVSFILNTLYYIPVFVLGLYLGQKAHDRLDDEKFKKVVYLALLISALNLLLR